MPPAAIFLKTTVLDRCKHQLETIAAAGSPLRIPAKVHAALYYPFSRCLDTLALKRSLLLYDRILFLDPVPPDVRSGLYVREGAGTSSDRRLSDEWRSAEPHYRLLEGAGLVEIVNPEALFNLDDAEEILARGVELDLEINRRRRLFRKRQTWQVLERRLPTGALTGHLRRQLQAVSGPYWDRLEPVVRVPYAVGSSLSLSCSLAAQQATGAMLMTDSPPHHELLLQRMRSGAYSAVPSMAAARPSPYKGQQIALQVIGNLVPDASLRRMSFSELITFRAHNEEARRDLAWWIEELTSRVEAREWDAALNDEVAQIISNARQVAEQASRWRTAASNAKRSAPADLVAAGFATLAAALTPGSSTLAGLLAGGGAYTGSAAARFMNDLRSRRPPEANAISYLLAAGKPR